jgi:hypothetical protein
MNGACEKTKVLRLRLKDNHAQFLGALAQTPHAKSVLDAGWSAFRTMLKYDFAGATFADVNEAFSTQTCFYSIWRASARPARGRPVAVERATASAR